MPDFWWVNHSQTSAQEINGRYLWSPKTETGPKGQPQFSQFYANMRLAKPGDIVLSYFKQRVRYVGRVTDYAFTAPKPPEFGGTGFYWSKDGWYLPVFWTPLTPPVRTMEMIDALRPLLPTKYSPINLANGGGNQKAYLAAIPKPVFDLVTGQSAFDAYALAHGGENSLTFEAVSDELDEKLERRVLEDASLAATQKTAIIQARRGQGRFRASVEVLEPACRLTGITTPALLIASHIKPWRVCASADERLDGMNGLMLTPDADHLFDRGFITFGDGGEVLKSPRVDAADLRRLGFEHLAMGPYGVAEAPVVWGANAFRPEQCGYLAYHRSDVFIA